MIKRSTQTVKATEPRLVLNCRFFQIVFRSLIVFYSKYKKSLKIEQEKECVFFIDLSSKMLVSVLANKFSKQPFVYFFLETKQFELQK